MWSGSRNMAYKPRPGGIRTPSSAITRRSANVIPQALETARPIQDNTEVKRKRPRERQLADIRTQFQAALDQDALFKAGKLTHPVYKNLKARSCIPVLPDPKVGKEQFLLVQTEDAKLQFGDAGCFMPTLDKESQSSQQQVNGAATQGTQPSLLAYFAPENLPAYKKFKAARDNPLLAHNPEEEVCKPLWGISVLQTSDELTHLGFLQIKDPENSPVVVFKHYRDYNFALDPPDKRVMMRVVPGRAAYWSSFAAKLQLRKRLRQQDPWPENRPNQLNVTPIKAALDNVDLASEPMIETVNGGGEAEEVEEAVS